MSLDLSGGEWNVTGLSLNIAGSKRVLETHLTHYSLKLKLTTQNLGVDKTTMSVTETHTHNNGGNELEIGDDDSDGQEERLGGWDERHHQLPLLAWRSSPFWQSRWFRGLFLLYLSIFDFLKLWVVSDNMYSERERERERKEQRRKKKKKSNSVTNRLGIRTKMVTF